MKTTTLNRLYSHENNSYSTKNKIKISTHNAPATRVAQAKRPRIVQTNWFQVTHSVTHTQDSRQSRWHKSRATIVNKTQYTIPGISAILTRNSRSVFCTGVSLNIHSFCYQHNGSNGWM